MKNVLLFHLAVLFVGSVFANQGEEPVLQKGVISGKIADAKTGETLIGAIVMVDEDPNLGAATDIDGNFVIQNVSAGKHKVKFRYVGYQPKEEEVQVKPAQVTTLNIVLDDETQEMKEVVVKSKINREASSAIVVMQKNSTIIQSGISSEDIKRSPDRSSADAIRRVSGATIQDGRYAIIRGLADRYNVAAVNGNLLPSTEPDRKTFAFDVFPSGILDNIIIAKTAQPDMPAEFAGGVIQLNTRDIPERNFFNLTIGQSFNEGTVFQPYKTYKGSATDFLGFDNGVRTLPAGFPGSLELNFENDKAKKVAYAKQLAGDWKVYEHKTAYPGQNYQLSGGLFRKKGEHQFGGIAAFTYSNNIRFTPIEQQRENADGTPDLNYKDQRYLNNVNWAALANVSAIISGNHKISFKNTYSVSATDNTTIRTGYDYDLTKDLKRTNLEFISTSVLNSVLSAEHFFKKTDIRFRWNGGVAWVKRNQPSSKRYSYERAYEADSIGAPNTNQDPYLMIFNNSFGSNPNYAGMFHSKLDEKIYSGGADVAIPFKLRQLRQSVKTGVYYQRKDRAFEARQLYFTARTSGVLPSSYTSLDASQIFQTNAIDSFLTVSQLANPEDQYRAKSNLYAGFVMMENNVTHRLKAVWGFRAEYFQQLLTTPNDLEFDTVQTSEGNVVRPVFVDTTYTKNFMSGIYSTDQNGRTKTVFPLLPSINLIYSLNEQMNLRLSYSQTVSRPEFREIAPFRYYDFVMESEVIGNTKLLQTLIHNLDLRYEFFMGKGQVLNASVFYKRFINPIEQTAFSGTSTQAFTYNNAKLANNVGVELEARKNFDFAGKYGENIVFSANLAYIWSRVDLSNVVSNAADELNRPLQGQSPYIVNLGLSYTEPSVGFGANLLYNLIGHRLYATGVVGNPGWYENGRHILDLQLSQRFCKNGIIRFTIGDLIAQNTVFYQNNSESHFKNPLMGDGSRFDSSDFVVRQEKNFRTYSLSIGYTF